MHFLTSQKTEEGTSVALNIQQLLDSIENEQFLQILIETDKKTLQILLLKMWGFSVREIADQIGLLRYFWAAASSIKLILSKKGCGSY